MSDYTPKVIYSVCPEHAEEMCGLICGHSAHCKDSHHTGCWSWDRIDSFVRFLLANKYKRKEKNEL